MAKLPNTGFLSLRTLLLARPLLRLAR